jgi:hypothetical protein
VTGSETGNGVMASQLMNMPNPDRTHNAWSVHARNCACN